MTGAPDEALDERAPPRNMLIRIEDRIDFFVALPSIGELIRSMEEPPVLLLPLEEPPHPWLGCFGGFEVELFWDEGERPEEPAVEPPPVVLPTRSASDAA